MQPITANEIEAGDQICGIWETRLYPDEDRFLTVERTERLRSPRSGREWMVIRYVDGSADNEMLLDRRLYYRRRA